MLKRIIMISILAIPLAGCVATGSYKSVDSNKAKELMDESTDYIIVDVRTQDEYDTSHIPNAVCIPNESIGDTDIKELPDKTQTVFVYCQSGVRSKEAAEKLADMGYTDVIEFGGITDWEGDVISSGKLFTGRYYNDDGICIELKENNTYSITSDDEEKDTGTWEHNKGLTLTSDAGDKYYFSIAKRMISFNGDYWNPELKERPDTFLYNKLDNGEMFTLEAFYEGNTVYMMTGNSFDFKTIDPDIQSISVKSPSVKDNINEQQEKDGGFILFRNTGRITSLYVDDTTLTVITSDGEDEAEIEVVKGSGEKETYKVEYDCNCG